MIKGIDVSRFQGSIDWKKVKATGIEFAIVRAGGSDNGIHHTGLYKDKNFLTNIIGAMSAGIHIGAYYVVGRNFTTAAEGQADALRFYNIIKNLYLDYPVYLDFEVPDINNKQGNTDAANAFCQQMEALGYYVGIYASDISGFKDRLFPEQLTAFDKWVARYGGKPEVIKSWGMWQTTSKGKVNGIKGFVDIDYSNLDYTKIITTKHLNGF